MRRETESNEFHFKLNTQGYFKLEMLLLLLLNKWNEFFLWLSFFSFYFFAALMTEAKKLCFTRNVVLKKHYWGRTEFLFALTNNVIYFRCFVDINIIETMGFTIHMTDCCFVMLLRLWRLLLSQLKFVSSVECFRFLFALFSFIHLFFSLFIYLLIFFFVSSVNYVVIFAWVWNHLKFYFSV